MSDPKADGIAAADEFIAAFNAQDHARLARSLNYPHIRLANGQFTTVADAETFERASRAGRDRLDSEGWHHTVVRSIDAVHAGADKVHLVMTVDRCSEDGSVYMSFDTLWIATAVDGHWGIQFRSSFLR